MDEVVDVEVDFTPTVDRPPAQELAGRDCTISPQGETETEGERSIVETVVALAMAMVSAVAVGKGGSSVDFRRLSSCAYHSSQTAIVGIAKAPVLPEPVGAEARQSPPPRIIGIHSS